MPPSDVLARLAADGLSLRLEGTGAATRIIVCPPAKITDAHRALIKATRDRLIDLLRFPSDAVLDALIQRAIDDPPDFATSGAVLRESAVLVIFGKMVACDPVFLAHVTAHNARCDRDWAAGGEAKAIQRPRTKRKE